MKENKLRILWLINSTLDSKNKSLSTKESYSSGWIIQQLKQLNNITDIEVGVLYPQSHSKSIEFSIVDNIKLYGFHSRKSEIKKEKTWEKDFINIINLFLPDIIHIHGTEFPHSCEMVKISNELKFKHKIVVSIQGVVKYIYENYDYGIPFWVKFLFTFRDLIKLDNVFFGKLRLKIRAENEKKTLLNVENVIGRTKYDMNFVKDLNPLSKYFHCNENLREAFYQSKWDINNIERYSIFLSQMNYPIKGFHIFLNSLTKLIKKYPDVKVYIAGSSNHIRKMSIFKSNIYYYYINKIIRASNFNKKIFYLGPLNEFEMAYRLSISHIFVLPSIVENSSNSLGEAMIVGTPVVSSFSAGNTEYIKNYENGLYFPINEPFTLGNKIDEVFSDDNLAKILSENARKSALVIHDNDANTKKLISIYRDIL